MLTFIVLFCLIAIGIFFYKVPAIHYNRNNLIIERQSVLLINKIVAIAFPILLISLLIGLRYDVGVDYLAYKETYEIKTSSNLLWSIENSEVEFLFTALCVILHNLNVPYYGMFIVMSIIPFYFFYTSFKRIDYLFVPALVFLCTSGVLFIYLNIMRQAISFFILLFAVQYIIKKSFFKFLFWVIIASGFHVTSLLFLPFYILSSCRKILFVNRSLALFLYLLTLVLSDQLIGMILPLIKPFIQDAYIQYIYLIEDWNMEKGSGLGLFLQAISDISLILMYPLCMKYFKEERFDIYFNIYFLGLLFSNVAGLNLLLSRVPFSFVSMRLMILSFTFWYVYRCWSHLLTQYKVLFLIGIGGNVLYFIGNLLSIEYKFISF